MKHHKRIPFLIVIFAFISISCKKEVEKKPFKTSENKALTLKYAEGFSVSNTANFKILEITNPWPKAEKSYRYALVNRDKLASITLNKEDFDGIIAIPVEKIVVTSTTHIPALDLLDIENTLIGFPGTDYISTESVRKRIDNNNVRELGKNEGINIEVLLETNPDVVIGFGVDGTNKSFETIKKSNIPVIYNGDWVEKSPLAKAEWIKFFGVLYNKEQQVDSIFNTIETGYNNAKKLAKNVSKQPTVLSGAMHKDVWYLPSGTSPEAQLLKNANVNYLYQNIEAQGSLALNFESVFDKCKNADIWISPSYYTSLEAMEKANSHYAKFEAFKNKKVYSFANTKGKTGGLLYYEQGTARPDLVLKDIIKVCHPELLPNYQTHFFKALQ